MATFKRNLNKGFRFKRWSRKGYAVFQSLNKVVHIGVVLMTYNLLTQPVIAQEKQDNLEISEADTLPEVEVISSDPNFVLGLTGVPQLSVQMPQTHVQDASELPEYLPGIDIRQRGIHGVQGDISIRGGSPEQVGIFLNGIPMNDIQTGHHNLNIPVPDISLSQIQSFSPATSLHAGSGSYSGALNFVSLPDDQDHIRVWLSAGQYQFADMNAAVNLHSGKAKHHISASCKSSDGYAENTDFKTQKAYISSVFPLTKKISATTQSGHLNKSFGAQSFYTDKYPLQFEDINASFVSARIESHGAICLGSGMYFRQHNDRFELFRESLYKAVGNYYIYNSDTAKFIPGVYEAWNYYPGHNYHRTDVFGYFADVKTRTKLGDFYSEFNHRHEKINSNVLGKDLDYTVKTKANQLFTKQAIRDQMNLFVSFQSISFSGFRAAVSTYLHYADQYSWKTYGSGRIHYQHNQSLSAWIAVNQSMRLPTFTDLYYSGPTNLGNPDLLPEDAIQIESGFFFKTGIIQMRMEAFHQVGRNTIDWVKYPDEDKYISMNYTRLQTTGAEFSAKVQFPQNHSLNSCLESIILNYTFINKTKDDSDYVSAYALDYLRHQAFLKVSHNVAGTGVGISWKARYQDREGSYTSNFQELEYETYFLADIALSYHHNSHIVFLECANVFDVKPVEIGGIQLPGRWLKLGLKLDFQLKALNN
jgi:vitamin B12 transporter